MVEKSLKEFKKAVNRIPMVYYVNEEKRTVVARPDITARMTHNEIIDKLFDCFQYSGVKTITTVDEVIYGAVDGMNKFRGIAKCAPEDTFDEKIGKAVARKKLIDRYYRMAFKVFKDYGNIMAKQAENLTKCVGFIALSGYENATDIVRISGGDENTIPSPEDSRAVIESPNEMVDE